MKFCSDPVLKARAAELIRAHVHEIRSPKLCSEPLVSVLIWTFNQRQFIRECVDSVLAQQTKFPFEILISDDCSTDGTAEIVREYQCRHPDKIRLFLAERNLWRVLPGLSTTLMVPVLHRASRGKYLALLEGDDYWTDPNKLQTQTEFLDTHPECSLCFHDAMVYYEDGSYTPQRFLSPELRCDRTTESLLDRYMIATLATVVRADCFPDLDRWPAELDLCDWTLAVLVSTRGRVSYIDEVMGVYRRHSGGVWSGVTQENRYQKQIEILQGFNKYFNYRHDAICRKAMVDRIIPLMECYATDGNVSNAVRCALMCLRLDPMGRIAGWLGLGRLVVRACIPALHRWLSSRLPWSISCYRAIKSRCGGRSEVCIGGNPDFPGRSIYYDRSKRFGWTEPQPSKEELAAYYAQNYRITRQETPNADYIAFMRRRADAQRKFIARYAPRLTFESVMDIGCSAGILLERFIGEASRLVGYEPDHHMAAYARRLLGDRATILNRDFAGENLAGERFSLITISHVLEHIRDPEPFLRGLAEHLDAGGLIFLEVPNDPSPCVKLQVSGNIKGLAHLHYFTVDSLGSLVRSCGLREIKMATYGPGAEAYWRKNTGSGETSLWRRMARKLGWNHDPSAGTHAEDLSSPLCTETPANGLHIRAIITK